jgi:hypothetical protein
MHQRRAVLLFQPKIIAISANSTDSARSGVGACTNSGYIQIMRQLKHIFFDHDRHHDRRPVLPGLPSSSAMRRLGGNTPRYASPGSLDL